MRRPYLGASVLLRGISSNGGTTHAAIVTRVHSNTLVNVTVFPDLGVPVTIPNVRFIQTEGHMPGDVTPLNPAAYWAPL